MLALALLFLIPTQACRELHDATPRLSALEDEQNTRVVILECAGQRALVYAKRANASAPWVEKHRISVTAPVANQTWFFDGAACAKGATGDGASINRAVLAHAKAATGELLEWKPAQSWHVDLTRNVWVKDNVKKMTCRADEI